MKTVYGLLVLTLVLSLSVFIAAQQPPQQNPQMNEDRLEAAHGALTSGKDKAAEASRLTQAVAAALPANVDGCAPVPRKNFVDEHVFGKIERDKIPHAPIAGDEEFLRRAYLDATGLLPTPE